MASTAFSALQEMPGRQLLHCSQLEAAQLYLLLPLSPKQSRSTTEGWIHDNPTYNGKKKDAHLDWQKPMKLPSFITLWHRRKTNHANQSSHSREPIPPLGSVSKHSAVATVIWIVNTVNELNCTDIHLFRSLTQSLIHVSEYLQPSIELQCEQTVVQIRHNNLPMPFMWLTEPAQSIHTAHPSQTNTHTHTHTKMPQVSEQIALLKHTQSAGSYLQFGGGSKVISASSFWILKQEEDLCYNHTIIQTHAHTLLYKSCLWKSIFECAHWIPHWFSNELLSYVTVLSRKINMEMYGGIFAILFKPR